MRKLLYLLNSSVPLSEHALLPPRNTDQDISVILIQEGVVQQQVPADHVYVLSDDAKARGITPTFPTVSYQDILRLMFESDVVVAL